MIPPEALGELLIVGAVPVAVVIAIAAAFLSRRYPLWARGLLGGALAVLLVMMIAGRRLSRPLHELRQHQKERFSAIEVGLTRQAVLDALGPADLNCPGKGYYVHQVMGTQKLLSSLYASTVERWVYFAPGPRSGGRENREVKPADRESNCQPSYADAEVGFNASGRVIWYIELTDETFLIF